MQGEPPPVDRDESIKPGQELVLNEALNVVETAGFEIQGEVVIMKEPWTRLAGVVIVRADEEQVAVIADPLRAVKLKVGDHILMDSKSGYLLEKLPKREVEELVLEEVPDVSYEDIGGLDDQIEAIRTRWSCRTCTPTIQRAQAAPPKGILLYGPPGCGKTHDRQGGGEQSGREGRGAARGEDQGATS